MSTHNRPPVVALVGATATGKSDLAVALAQAVDGEIINADAMQFYQGMDIGTAKITEAEQQGIVHHLLDIYPLHVEATVAGFQTQARNTITDIRTRERIPILVGGSGLYVRAALDTLEFPPTNTALRQQLIGEVELSGIDHLVKELQTVDPDAAHRLSDERRIIRAVEVHRLTGRPFSSFMPQREYHPDTQPVVQIGLSIPRTLLHERVEQRVYKMFDAGWVEEVSRLQDAGLAQAPTASKAIGYRQMLDYLAGSITKNEAIESTIVATRRFARRQETWFKADHRVHWIDTQSDDLVADALTVIESR